MSCGTCRTEPGGISIDCGDYGDDVGACTCACHERATEVGHALEKAALMERASEVVHAEDVLLGQVAEHRCSDCRAVLDATHAKGCKYRAHEVLAVAKAVAGYDASTIGVRDEMILKMASALFTLSRAQHALPNAVANTRMMLLQTIVCDRIDHAWRFDDTEKRIQSTCAMCGEVRRL